MSPKFAESVITDPLDRAIIRALQVSPRAPFRLLADVLATSEQTVARRYRRLCRTGVLRVTTVLNPTALGQSNWALRVQCKPGGSGALAQALAQRDDVGWVSLAGGGSEVLCVLRARTEQARDDLLLQRLPRAAPVLGVTASVVLHPFLGAHSDDWTELRDCLDAGAEARLRAWSDVEPGGDPDPTDPVELSATDLAMLDVLVRDGRAPYAAVAAAVGLGEAQATRRLRALLRRGVAYFDVDVAAAALGIRTPAYLWLQVTPAALASAGTALAAEREVAYAAAVSGAHNLTAAVMCRNLEALYTFVITRVGALDGVQAMEVSPLWRVVKQAGAMLDGDRLATA
ncbi:MAG TPA: Lrp/AsnC family transcriptional regulator [Jatrophihabitans sp.]|nr:Lrp/AsnC family transcriptional regulator [Jatrophihabitans sp.]